MPKRLINYNPLTGVSCYHEYDSVQRKTLITHEYDDVSAILDANKQERNDFDRSKQSDTWWKVGSIPLSICTKWMLEEGIDVFNKRDWDRVQRKLNDPEWRYLRTSPGGV